MKQINVFSYFTKAALIAAMGLVSATALHAQDENATCSRVGNAIEKYPTKVDGLYQQNNSPSCAFCSLINANILAGADDTNGKFFNAMKVCLNKKGHPNAWLGLYNPGETASDGSSEGANVIGSGPLGKALHDCKKEIMAAQGKPVSFSTGFIVGTLGTPFVTAGTAQQTANDPCEKIKKAMTGGGSAMLTFQLSIGKHAVAVRSISCNHGAPPSATIHLIDPNYPNIDIIVDVNGSGTVTNSSGDPVANRYSSANIITYAAENRI